MTVPLVVITGVVIHKQTAMRDAAAAECREADLRMHFVQFLAERRPCPHDGVHVGDLVHDEERLLAHAPAVDRLVQVPVVAFVQRRLESGKAGPGRRAPARRTAAGCRAADPG